MSDVQMWQVQLPTGAVHEITLEQLDLAFEAGHINESTFVREVGAHQWSTLAQVAGLEPQAASTAPSSVAPYAYSVTPSVPVPSPLATQAEPYRLAADSIELPAPKKKTGLFVGGIVAIAALALFAIGISSASSGVEAPPAAAAALAAPPPPPVATALSGANNGANPFTDSVAQSASRLTDEQKKALLDADQKRDSAMKSRSQQKNEAAAARAPARRGKPDKTFHKGGNQYDPLNSNL
jgi:hypothetical protein